MNIEIVKEFLDFPLEFWEYIKKRIIYVDSKIEGNEIFYNTFMKFDNESRLIDIKVMIPYIIDIKTACVNIHELKHAYDLFLELGNIVNINGDEYEKNAIKLEKKFYKKYNN